jgi:hypothetical protein
MTRRLTATMVLLFGLVLLERRVSATDNPNPPNDFLVGAGEFGAAITGKRFSVGAIAGPLGEDPRGHLHVTFPDPSFNVDSPVECLGVVGNRAAAGSKVLEETATGAQRLVLLAEDNGQPSDPVPDRAFPARLTIVLPNPPPPPAQAFCAVALTSVAIGSLVLEPIERGNVTVHDGQPTTPGVAGATPLPELGAGTWRLELPDGTVMMGEVP